MLIVHHAASTAPSWLPGVLAALGVVLGASITSFTQWKTQSSLLRKQRSYERATLATAFAVEMKLLRLEAEARGQVKILEGLIKATKTGVYAGRSITQTVASFLLDGTDVEVGLPIYKAHRQDIGKLGPLAEQVAEFYVRVFMVRTTIYGFQRGEYDDLENLRLGLLLEGELSHWQEACRIADLVVPKMLALAQSLEARP